MPEFDGKVAIVTGAGRLRGIGRGAAVAFAKLGADVVVTGTGRDPSRYPDDEKAVGWRDIESTAEQVRALGVRALPLLVDVTNEDEVQMMVDRTLEELGRVDFLVNNAAWARGPDRVSFLDLGPGHTPERAGRKDQRRVLLQQGGDEGPAGAGRGRGDSLRLVRRRQDRGTERDGLCCGLLRPGRHDAVPGSRTGAARHKRELCVSGGGGHVSRRRCRARRWVGGDHCPDAIAKGRDRRRAWRHNRLPMHGGRLVPPRTVHQRQRRHDDGAVTRKFTRSIRCLSSMGRSQ